MPDRQYKLINVGFSITERFILLRIAKYKGWFSLKHKHKDKDKQVRTLAT